MAARQIRIIGFFLTLVGIYGILFPLQIMWGIAVSVFIFLMGIVLTFAIEN